MKPTWKNSAVIASVALGMTALAPPAMARETAVAPERNPPGDIPDSQVFVQYTSPAGFSIKVPEGWSRAERADGVRFSDKYNVIDLAVSKADRPPGAAAANTLEAALRKDGRAVEIRSVKNVKLGSGPAVLIFYSSNSEPNPVTSRQIRLEHHRYLLFRNGVLVTLDLSAPLGADNADQWRLISNAFRWR
jgi:hypothetical protein